MLRALQDAADSSVAELAIGERCGITMPTRYAFRLAGYDALLARLPSVKRYLFDEVMQVEVPLRHPHRLRDYLYVPEPVVRADCFINLPKFKSHPWTTVTFSLKNYIGLQDDRHRLIDHDHRLNEKVRDLQYVIQPRFIAIDAIVAGAGRMLTPEPFPLGLVIMGDNQLAVDAVCCRIVGLDPREVAHIRLSEQAGFGSTAAEQITLLGDVSLKTSNGACRGVSGGVTAGRAVLCRLEDPGVRRAPACRRADGLLLGGMSRGDDRGD